MKYIPWEGSDGQRGFKCVAEGGSESYVYLNPSDNDIEADADIFVYAGTTGDPAEDAPQVFVVPVNTPERTA